MMSCQKEENKPEVPALEGRWQQMQYKVTQPNAYGGTISSTQPSTANFYITISADSIKYQDPSLNRSITQAYTRQGKKLFIATGTSNRRIETVEELSKAKLTLRIAQQTGVLLSDSLVREFYYERR